MKKINRVGVILCVCLNPTGGLIVDDEFPQQLLRMNFYMSRNIAIQKCTRICL